MQKWRYLQKRSNFFWNSNNITLATSFHKLRCRRLYLIPQTSCQPISHLISIRTQLLSNMSTASTPYPRPSNYVMLSQPSTTWGQRHLSLVAKCNEAGIKENSILIGDSHIHRLETKHEDIFKKYFPTYLNLGIGGDKTNHVIWRIKEHGIPLRINTGIVICGTNKTLRRSSRDSR